MAARGSEFPVGTELFEDVTSKMSATIRGYCAKKDCGRHPLLDLLCVVWP